MEINTEKTPEKIPKTKAETEVEKLSEKEYKELTERIRKDMFDQLINNLDKKEFEAVKKEVDKLTLDFASKESEVTALKIKFKEKFQTTEAKLKLLETKYKGLEKAGEGVEKKLTAKDQEIADLKAKGDEIKSALEATDKGNFFLRFKFLSWVIPSSIAIVTTIISVIISVVALKKDDSKSEEQNPILKTLFTDEEILLMKHYVQSFFGKPQEEFWNNITKFIQNYKGELDLTSQTIIASYIKEYDKDSFAKWVWGTGEEAGFVTQAYNAYNTSKKSSDIYKAVATMKVNRPNPSGGSSSIDISLPHSVAADICELTLFKIILS